MAHALQRSLALVLPLLLGTPASPVPEARGEEPERVTPIKAPSPAFPTEDQSKDVTQFSFIAYGDTRGRQDGTAIQQQHSMVVDSMLKQISKLQSTPHPVRFVLQSGDTVENGRKPQQWTTSFVPLINRLTDAGVPYFLAPGNHDVTSAATAEDPDRQLALRNYLDAMANLIPKEGSPRRLSGYPTYALGYGNTFVIAFDADIADDEKQFQWVKAQLEGLDRNRFVNVLALCHQAPFSSGPHGGAKVEAPTTVLRSKYMPLFHTHHVRAVFSGHEHLFEHWVEHYTDASGTHRLDLLVSGGGGAPIYAYTGEPDLRDYLKANEGSKTTLQHVVRPSVEKGLNPYHYLVVRVNGDRLSLEVIGVDWGTGFEPYHTNKTDLTDPGF
jgi:hypothetical protein